MNVFKRLAFASLCAMFAIFLNDVSVAQIFGHGAETQSPKFEKSLFKDLSYRSIGPYRGGRSIAVSGHDSQPYTFYTGYAGGGVF